VIAECVVRCVVVTRLTKIKEWVDAHDPGSAIIPFSGSLETKLLDMNDDDSAAYLKEHQTTRYVSLLWRVHSIVMGCLFVHSHISETTDGPE